MIDNSGQNLQSILMSTTKRATSIWTIISSSTFEGLIFQCSISPENTSNVRETIRCSRIYIMAPLTVHTVQKIAEVCIALVHAAGILPISKKVSSYLIFDGTRNVF